ncbi:UNVERIFIED_CONTAM: hypothetical protein Slati_2370900 [Sesamum latifolium]|uniref:Uncharacterized protein n=1 Tax=Sesamum latifolium TaxID=2727402 RepID=A0AAW2WB16_9LAMI
MVIPGPSNSKHLIDVYLDSLSEELQNLWHVSVLTRDSVKNETFTMHAALMWTMNDLPAYGMASRWSTAGVMGVQFVWKTYMLSISRMVERRATLISKGSSSPRIIPTIGTRKHSLRTE